jgi:PAS domain S-box-containing protein
MTLDRTGTILSVNQQGASSLGYLPQELIQKPVFQLFNQTEQKTLIDNFINLFQDSSKGEVGNWELSLNCPASKMRAVKVAAEILHATQDSQQLILMVLEDITHEKLTAGTLQESEQ